MQTTTDPPPSYSPNYSVDTVVYIRIAEVVAAAETLLAGFEKMDLGLAEVLGVKYRAGRAPSYTFWLRLLVRAEDDNHAALRVYEEFHAQLTRELYPEWGVPL